MRNGIITSAALHVGVIGATLIAWPHALDLSDEPADVVPIEMVTIADTTNVAPTVTEEQKAPPPEEPTPPLPQPELAPLPEQKVEVAPSLEAALPPSKVPEPAPAPETAQDAPAAAPRKPAVPRPRPQPDKQQKFDVDSVLALLDKKAPKAATPPANAKVADRAMKGIGEQNASTVDIRDALLSQMRECWNVPAGAPNPAQLIVQVRVFLAPDGSLAQPPQLMPESRAAAASNPYSRTAAEAALRAINVCEPYHGLPAEKYQMWREIVMTFDPSRMIR